MIPEHTLTEGTNPQNNISPFGCGLLGSIVSEIEPADLPLPRHLVYSKLKAIESARAKLAHVLENDILRTEKGITPEDEKLLKSLESSEVCMRTAYEHLEDVWSIYTNTIDRFMYMRAKREAYQTTIEKLGDYAAHKKPIDPVNRTGGDSL